MDTLFAWCLLAKFNAPFSHDVQKNLIDSDFRNFRCLVAGKSLSEARILAATYPQYVKRLFIELRVQ